MFYLCSQPSPTFCACDRKVFHPAEYHVTRTYKRSVLILMLGGVLRFREDGKDVELIAGEYYIQREGLLQEGVCLGESPEYYYIEFNGTYSENERDGLPLRGRYRKEVVLPQMEECVESFYGRTPSRFFLSSCLCRVLDLLSTENADASEPSRLAARIRDHLETNYASKISIEEVAEKFGYSKNHLNRVFREAYGVTPHHFLAGVRIAKAHWLLTNTDFPVKQITDMVGYADASAFYRGFVKVYGISPREARTRAGG